MTHEHTGFHSPIALPQPTTRRVRAGRADPDFAFATPIAKKAQVAKAETADEITERLMRRLRATEPVAKTWQRVAVWVGAPALCFGVAAAIYLRFFN